MDFPLQAFFDNEPKPWFERQEHIKSGAIYTSLDIYECHPQKWTSVKIIYCWKIYA